MRRVRRAYYDIFSRFYDRFVALHSRDRQGVARKFLVDRVPIQNGGWVLDLCTRTGTLLSRLQAKVGPREVLERYFKSIEKVVAPAGKSKVMTCRK